MFVDMESDWLIRPALQLLRAGVVRALCRSSLMLVFTNKGEENKEQTSI